MGNFYYTFFDLFYRLMVPVLFIPSAYVIEAYGLNKAISLGMLMTMMGLWISYLNLPTLGICFVGIGMPFLLNTTTKVSGKWFGPKGRNISTTILILAYYIP
jgi:hypothetical protein